VDYFREAPFDEARVAYQLVREVVEERLAESRKGLAAKVKRQRAPRAKGDNPPSDPPQIAGAAA